MLHVYFGNDTPSVRQAANDFVTRKTGVSIERIDSDSYTPGILADLSGATSLFGSETLYVIDTPSLTKDFFDDVLEHLDVLAESTNTVVVIEESMLAPEKKKFTKHASQIEEFKKTAADRFNTFALADHLAKKDKRSLWVGLQEATQQGLAAEEIIGVLWWQLKSLQLAHVTNTPEEAGMKSFPYQKAKRAVSNFSPGEVETLSMRLLKLYHAGHSGRTDINAALEKWVLTL